MAEAVARAVTGGRNLVVQAGTGTGKSLAYLVPAALSGRTVVIATATKALQDQLADKDLPFVAAHLGHPFTFAVLKGRANYLCLDKAREIGAVEDGEGQLDLADVDTGELGRLGRQVVRLLKWAKDSDTGDRADLDFEPSPAAWSRLSVSAAECPGAARCPMGEPCFAEVARRRAADADIVVVNTHLYAMHLASGGFLLPEHDVVVFDEAHQLEDVIASALDRELSGGRFIALARSLRAVAGPEGERDATGLDDAALRLERALQPLVDRRLPSGPAGDEGIAAALTTCLDRANRALTALRAGAAEAGDAAGRKQRAMKAATSLLDDLIAAAEMTDDQVAWVEGPAHSPTLRIAPIDVAGLLAHLLWDDIHSAVLTSATIPPNLPARVGLPPDSFAHIDVGSPFDHAGHAVLYCARALPDPRSPDYEPAMHEELEALIRAAGGRTLALFTSWRAMRAAAEALKPRLPWHVLTQDDLPKPALVAAFTDDETSCLFATMGFWQGLDVPGPALSMVVIDRLPFPRPDEPLLQARRDRSGPGAFEDVDLPRAATLLAQGAGRLIRSATDRGVVAVLDPRLAKAAYRTTLLAGLPPMRRTGLRANVESFLADLRARS